MPLAASYPQTRYDPSPLVDLSDPKQRKRLSRSGLQAFFAIMEQWEVTGKEACLLLGGMSHGTYYGLKKNPDKVLDQDRLQRISFLIGIFKGLNILYSEVLADAWVKQPNTNRLFHGRTPLQFMIAGGLPAMQAVRRLIDARRGR